MFATNHSTTPPSIPIQSPLQCLLLFNDCPSCLMARHLDGHDSDEGYQEKESERFHLVVFQIDVNLVWVLQTRSLKLDKTLKILHNLSWCHLAFKCDVVVGWSKGPSDVQCVLDVVVFKCVEPSKNTWLFWSMKIAAIHIALTRMKVKA